MLTKFASVMIAVLIQRDFITVRDQTYQQIWAVNVTLQSESTQVPTVLTKQVVRKSNKKNKICRGTT